MSSTKQGNYWYQVWYDTVLDWELNPGPTVLIVSTLPRGYRGGGMVVNGGRNSAFRKSIKQYSYPKHQTLYFTGELNSPVQHPMNKVINLP